VKSEERDKTRWGINHGNHLIFELSNYKFKAFNALMEYLYTDSVKSLRDSHQ